MYEQDWLMRNIRLLRSRIILLLIMRARSVPTHSVDILLIASTCIGTVRKHIVYTSWGSCCHGRSNVTLRTSGREGLCIQAPAKVRPMTTPTARYGKTTAHKN